MMTQDEQSTYYHTTMPSLLKSHVWERERAYALHYLYITKFQFCWQKLSNDQTKSGGKEKIWQKEAKWTSFTTQRDLNTTYNTHPISFNNYRGYICTMDDDNSNTDKVMEWGYK